MGGGATAREAGTLAMAAAERFSASDRSIFCCCCFRAASRVVAGFAFRELRALRDNPWLAMPTEGGVGEVQGEKTAAWGERRGK